MKGKRSKRATAPMDYYDHLEVLRWKILRILAVAALASAVAFVFIDPLASFLKWPVGKSAVTLVSIRPYEKFLAYLKIALLAGVAAAIPYAVAELASFVTPGLNRREKAVFIPASIAVPAVFYGGIIFAYTVIVPAALNFFLNFAPGDAVRPFWSVGEYFDLVISLLTATGILFLLPPVLLLLIRFRILSVSTLSRYRGMIILAIAILAGAFSPPDVVSQLLVGVPLYLLFELTVLIGRLL